MIGYRAIRDPANEDALSECEFLRLVAAGGSIADAIEFVDAMLEFLGTAREGIFSPKRVELKVLLELKKCIHPQLRKDLSAYSMLHPADTDRNWEYFVGVLNRIKRVEMSSAVTAADTRALLPPVVPPKKGAAASCSTPNNRCRWR